MQVCTEDDQQDASTETAWQIVTQDLRKHGLDCKVGSYDATVFLCPKTNVNFLHLMWTILEPQVRTKGLNHYLKLKVTVTRELDRAFEG